jgi:lysozyme
MLLESEAFAGQPSCESAELPRGIDVSDSQRNTVWPEIQTSGIRFAFVKATEGRGFVNRNFASAWNKLPGTAIRRGAYHYYKPTDDPAEQAALFLQVVGDLTTGDLPPLLDLEESGEVDAATLLSRVAIWLERVEQATGKTPILYTFPYFWEKLGNPKGFGRYPLFIAETTRNPCPRVPASWKNWTFWQQGSGRVNGVIGASVDRDLFNGSSEELTAFAESGSMPMAVGQ